MIDGATDPNLHDVEKEKANKNVAKKTVQRDLKQQITPRESGARHEEDPPADADPRNPAAQSCAWHPRRICLLHQPQDPRVARLRPTRGLSPPSGRAGPDLARPTTPTGASRLGRPRGDRICRCLGRGIPHRMARQPRLILRQTKGNLSTFFLIVE